MFKITLLALSVMALSACSSSVKQLDTEIDVKGSTTHGVVGIQSGEAVIQEKRSADEELRIQQWRNYQLENDFNHEYSMTEWCYTDLADPRLGGKGEKTDAPDFQKLKSSVAIKEELGLDGEKLVVVKTYAFAEQLKVEREYESALTTMLKEVKKTRSTCERQMGAARLKAGLPSKRTEGKIKITPDGKVEAVIQEPENSLDDAFRFKKAGIYNDAPLMDEEIRTPATKTVYSDESMVIENSAPDRGN